MRPPLDPASDVSTSSDPLESGDGDDEDDADFDDDATHSNAKAGAAQGSFGKSGGVGQRGSGPGSRSGAGAGAVSERSRVEAAVAGSAVVAAARRAAADAGAGVGLKTSATMSMSGMHIAHLTRQRQPQSQAHHRHHHHHGSGGGSSGKRAHGHHQHAGDDDDEEGAASLKSAAAAHGRRRNSGHSSDAATAAAAAAASGNRSGSPVAHGRRRRSLRSRGGANNLNNNDDDDDDTGGDLVSSHLHMNNDRDREREQPQGAQTGPGIQKLKRIVVATQDLPVRLYRAPSRTDIDTMKALAAVYSAHHNRSNASDANSAAAGSVAARDAQSEATLVAAGTDPATAAVLSAAAIPARALAATFSRCHPTNSTLEHLNTDSALLQKRKRHSVTATSSTSHSIVTESGGVLSSLCSNKSGVHNGGVVVNGGNPVMIFEEITALRPHVLGANNNNINNTADNGSTGATAPTPEELEDAAMDAVIDTFARSPGALPRVFAPLLSPPGPLPPTVRAAALAALVRGSGELELESFRNAESWWGQLRSVLATSIGGDPAADSGANTGGGGASGGTNAHGHSSSAACGNSGIPAGVVVSMAGLPPPPTPWTDSEAGRRLLGAAFTDALSAVQSLRRREHYRRALSNAALGAVPAAFGPALAPIAHCMPLGTPATLTAVAAAAAATAASAAASSTAQMGANSALTNTGTSAGANANGDGGGGAGDGTGGTGAAAAVASYPLRSDRDRVEDLLAAADCAGVFVDPVLEQRFRRFTSEILSPLFHFTQPQYSFIPDADSGLDDLWQAYVSANITFANAISRLPAATSTRATLTVWVHNLHLLLLPASLRAKLPRTRIGLFCHTPFPASEVLRALPRRDALLRSMLAADLIGFHTYDYARHFLSSTKRVLNLDFEPMPGGAGLSLEFAGRTITLQVSHMGIRSWVYLALADDTNVHAAEDEIRQSLARPVPLLPGSTAGSVGVNGGGSNAVPLPLPQSAQPGQSQSQSQSQIILTASELTASREPLLFLRSYRHFLRSRPDLAPTVTLVDLVSGPVAGIAALVRAGLPVVSGSAMWPGVHTHMAVSPDAVAAVVAAATAAAMPRRPNSTTNTNSNSNSTSASASAAVYNDDVDRLPSAFGSALWAQGLRAARMTTGPTGTTGAAREAFVAPLGSVERAVAALTPAAGSNPQLSPATNGGTYMYNKQPLNVTASMYLIAALVAREYVSILQEFGPNSLVLISKDSLTTSQKVSVYRAARVAAFMPLWDGLNLLPFEFTAAQDESDPGAVVISEFIGCARTLSGVLRTNPWDADQVAVSMAAAVNMPLDRRRSRHARRWLHVMTHDLASWVATFTQQLAAAALLDADLHLIPTGLNNLRLVGVRRDFFRLQSPLLVPAFAATGPRLLLLDYDGTLTPPRLRKGTAPAAASHARLLQSLEALCSDPLTAVFIVSGRGRAALQSLFGSLPALGLVAEEGVFVRWPVGWRGQRRSDGAKVDRLGWEALFPLLGPKWKSDVLDVAREYATHTDGSWVEDKEASVEWHYDQTDAQYGSWQAVELSKLLTRMLADSPIRVKSYDIHRIIMAKPAGASKGAVATFLTHACLGIAPPEYIYTSSSTGAAIANNSSTNASAADAAESKGSRVGSPAPAPVSVPAPVPVSASVPATSASGPVRGSGSPALSAATNPNDMDTAALGGGDDSVTVDERLLASVSSWWRFPRAAPPTSIPLLLLPSKDAPDNEANLSSSNAAHTSSNSLNSATTAGAGDVSAAGSVAASASPLLAGRAGRSVNPISGHASPPGSPRLPTSAASLTGASATAMALAIGTVPATAGATALSLSTAVSNSALPPPDAPSGVPQPLPRPLSHRFGPFFSPLIFCLGDGRSDEDVFGALERYPLSKHSHMTPEKLLQLTESSAAAAAAATAVSVNGGGRYNQHGALVATDSHGHHAHGHGHAAHVHGHAAHGHHSVGVTAEGGYRPARSHAGSHTSATHHGNQHHNQQQMTMGALSPPQSPPLEGSTAAGAKLSGRSGLLRGHGSLSPPPGRSALAHGHAATGATGTGAAHGHSLLTVPGSGSGAGAVSVSGKHRRDATGLGAGAGAGSGAGGVGGKHQPAYATVHPAYGSLAKSQAEALASALRRHREQEQQQQQQQQQRQQQLMMTHNQLTLQQPLSAAAVSASASSGAGAGGAAGGQTSLQSLFPATAAAAAAAVAAAAAARASDSNAASATAATGSSSSASSSAGASGAGAGASTATGGAGAEARREELSRLIAQSQQTLHSIMTQGKELEAQIKAVKAARAAAASPALSSGTGAGSVVATPLNASASGPSQAPAPTPVTASASGATAGLAGRAPWAPVSTTNAPASATSNANSASVTVTAPPPVSVSVVGSVTGSDDGGSTSHTAATNSTAAAWRNANSGLSATDPAASASVSAAAAAAAVTPAAALTAYPATAAAAGGFTQALPGAVLLCTVGLKPSKARCYVNDEEDALALLLSLEAWVVKHDRVHQKYAFITIFVMVLLHYLL